MGTPTEPKPRSLVIMSRKWDNPHIRVTVDKVGISVSMMIDDFLDALRIELAAQGMQTTQNALDQAATRVLEGMKEETRRAM